MGIIAAFLRAIRAGAIHFRHCSVLLTHFGRLGPPFDLCAKLVVDILREEGMYKQNGETVVSVITQALREVS
jgi:cohesin complex subunit SA-1/2